MKVTFVYTDYNPYGYNQNKFNLGIAILSACLKRAGHQTELIHISNNIDQKYFVARVLESKPSLIAFSSITNMWPYIRKFTQWISELNIPTVHGGVHPTIAPDEVLSTEGVEIICRAEGEVAIVELCNNLQAGINIDKINNLWIKKGNGDIIKNPIRPLIEDLDTLPFLDYEIFNYAQLEDVKTYNNLVVMASRGCPYSCTYCCNHLLKSLYPNNSKYLRFKSVDRLIDEIEDGLKQYPFLEKVRFLDDTLSQNKKWFDEFVEKYSSRIKLTYTCNDRVNQINAHIADGFKKSRCALVELGIESGNEYIRNTIMQRRISEKKTIEAYAILRDYGINTTAFNIFGVPHETMQTLLDTVKLNARARPDYFTNAYFQPFKGTDLYNVCRENNILFDESKSSFFERPTVSLKTVSEYQIMFIYKYFYLLTRLYGRFFRNTEDRAQKLISNTDLVLCSRYFPYTLFILIYDIFMWLKRVIRSRIKKMPIFYRLLRFIWYKVNRIL